MASATTFLKKLGYILANAAGIAAGIGPIIKPFLGSNPDAGKYIDVATNDLTQIASVVTTTEALIQAPGSGAAKLAASTPLVVQILKTSQALSGKKIANEALFEQGAQKIASGVADVLNAIHPDEAQHAGG